MRMANTVKLNGVRPKVIRLQLFPFSLRDVVATWFKSLHIGLVTNWEELVEAYMGSASYLLVCLILFPSVGITVVQHCSTVGIHRSFPQGVV